MTETTQTVRKAVATRAAEPPAVAVTRTYEGQFSEILPDHVDAKAFVGSALATLRRDKDLLAAANNSTGELVNALMTCASLGHAPGSKEFYLTARRSKDHQGKPVIVGIEGYRGVIERMYRSGAVASVIVREVCKNDRFEFTEGVNDVPFHDVDWFNEAGRGEMIGVYAYAKLVTGATSRVVILSRKDVEAVKARSDAGKAGKGPWATDERAMWWKTAAHRLEPWVPTSAEYRREALRAQAAAGEARHAVNTDTGEIIGAGGHDDDVVDAEVVEDGQPS